MYEIFIKNTPYRAALRKSYDYLFELVKKITNNKTTVENIISRGIIYD